MIQILKVKSLRLHRLLYLHIFFQLPKIKWLFLVMSWTFETETSILCLQSWFILKNCQNFNSFASSAYGEMSVFVCYQKLAAFICTSTVCSLGWHKMRKNLKNVWYIDLKRIIYWKLQVSEFFERFCYWLSVGNAILRWLRYVLNKLSIINYNLFLQAEKWCHWVKR